MALRRQVLYCTVVQVVRFLRRFSSKSQHTLRSRIGCGAISSTTLRVRALCSTTVHCVYSTEQQAERKVLILTNILTASVLNTHRELGMETDYLLRTVTRQDYAKAEATQGRRLITNSTRQVVPA